MNLYSRRLELFEQNLTELNTLNNKCLQALRNQIFYGYKKIPASFLEIEFPNFDLPVIYEDHDLQFDSRLDTQEIKLSSNQIYFVEMTSFSDNFWIADFDDTPDVNDPVQAQYLQILRDDENARELKPNKDEVRQIEKALMKPILGELELAERNMIWRFRYHLMQNKNALSHFLHCVSWNYPKEEAEALSLLEKWAKIDYTDAIHLLSSFFCANEFYNHTKKPIEPMQKIRAYAVKILYDTPNNTILSILLQLVQALKYEKLDMKSPLLNFLLNRAISDLKMATHLFWHLKVSLTSFRIPISETSVLDRSNQKPIMVISKRFSKKSKASFMKY